MDNNKNLHKAKKAKNDEFYTRYADIEKEICHYDLRGKKIYCNCDDYRWSNFVKYFHDNFEALGIREICATGYDLGQGAYLYRFDGKDATVSKLEGNGDFRSEECVELLKQSDVVVSNPPFSLFREYVAQIMEYGKKCIIIGNGNAVTYKEVFPLIKNGQIWTGVRSWSGGMWLELPDGTIPLKGKYIKGVPVVHLGNIVWFTNIDHTKHNQPLILTKTYSPELYPKYDNYDAINVDRVADIPMDYDGVIGVPITFLDKYCPTQFEIVGLDRYIEGNKMPNKRMHINGKEIYARILIRKMA